MKKKNKLTKYRIVRHLIAVRLSNLRRALEELKKTFRGHDKDVLESFASTISNSIYTLERIMLKDDAKKER